MAKGDPSGIFNVEALDRASEEGFATSVEREFLRVASAFELGLARSVEFLNTEPAKPREGLVTGADGTNWDPGDGKGLYAYFDDQWNFLGGGGVTDHGALTGLADDDHPQYALVAALADVAFSGDYNDLINTPGAGYTDEQAQDAVGQNFDSTLEYVDGTPLFRRAAITGDVDIPLGSNVSTLDDTAVTPGTYNSANITVNSQGRITNATNGGAAGLTLGIVSQIPTLQLFC